MLRAYSTEHFRYQNYIRCTLQFWTLFVIYVLDKQNNVVSTCVWDVVDCKLDAAVTEIE